MKGRKLIAAKSEADIYEALGLAYKPELREGRGESSAPWGANFPSS